MKKVLLIVGLVIGGFVAVIGGFVWLVAGITAPIKEAADRFDAAIAARNVDAMYEEMSLAMRQRYTADDLVAQLSEARVWGQDGDFYFNSRGFENSEGYGEGTWTGPEGAVLPVRLSFIWEGDEWRIIAFRFGATQ